MTLRIPTGFIFFLLFASFGVPVFGQDLHPMQFPTGAECGSSLLNDPEVIRTAWENTRRFYPGIEDAMQRRRLEKRSVPYTVGVQETFWVYNFEQQRFDTVGAELRRIGALSYVWVAVRELQNNHVTTTEVDEIGRTLESTTPARSIDSTKGILQIDRQVFGDPPNINAQFEKGKGDGRTHFLICDIQDGWDGFGSFVAGFFISVDVDPNSGFQGNSNRRDMLYIDSYPSIFFNNTRRTSLVLPTLAHEFQHLIHWNYDPHEITFFNEGLSEYAEALCGYSLRSATGYLRDTNVPLLSWSRSLDDYGRAALWTRFIAEQYGLPFLRRFTQHPMNGVPGFEMSLSDVGIAASFDMTAQNFFTANWIGANSLAPPSNRYTSAIGGRPALSSRYLDPNATANGDVVQQGARYLEFSPGAKDFRITFSGDFGLKVRAVETGERTLRVRDVPIGSSFTSPEFGTTLSSIVFVVSNSSLSTTARFSFVSSGEVVRFVTEEKYDDGTPDPFLQGIAPYVGFGNNSTSRGIAVRFHPVVPGNVLRGARMMVAFNQEFANGTALPNDDRDFMFHVWGDKNGRPGRDLIAPFLVTVNRSEFPVGTFVDIDLSPYASSLTNLRGPIYLGFMEDEDDSVGTYAAVDNSTPTDYSYVYRGPNHPRAPNKWETFREVSALNNNILDGFNAMFRAIFEYSDSSAAPRLALGYLQNPVLSEFIDVIVSSQDDLRAGSLSGSLTQTSGTSALRLFPIPRSMKAFIDTSHRFSASGAVTIRARGAKRFGVYFADTSITFAARLLKKDARGAIATVDGEFTVEIDERGIRKETYLTARRGVSFPEEIGPELLKADRVFSVGPAALELATPAIVRYRAEGKREGWTLARLVEGKWHKLATRFDERNRDLTASTNRLGTFGLVRKEDVSGNVDDIPLHYALHQNYPNPFNPSTTIRYELPEPTAVRLIVYDVLGREVAVLVAHEQPAGVHSVLFDASHLSSGIYLYRLQTSTFTKTRKLIFLR
jgi:hypothetical protein